VPIDTCKICGTQNLVQKLIFRETTSFIFVRNERLFDGVLCHACMWNIFVQFTSRTLFGTWLGIIGMILGPIYIVSNIFNLIKGQIRFRMEIKSVRK